MKEMKRLALRLFFAVEIFIFTFVYLFGTNGMQAVMRIKNEDLQLQNKIIAAQQDIEYLQKELQEWHSNPLYKEKVARQQLQMAKKGETIYFVSN